MATANISKRFCIVYITCPKIEVAESLAKMLLEKRTIACANVLPNVTSIYRWNGEIKQDPEVLMMIKTRQDKLCALKSIVEKEHPYDVPEIVSVPMQDGSDNYLQWLDSCLDDEK